MKKLLKLSLVSFLVMVILSIITIQAQNDVYKDYQNSGNDKIIENSTLNSIENTTGLIIKIDYPSDAATSYTFSQSLGTYTLITGGTVVASSIPGSGTNYLDDVNYSMQTIPFTFTFNDLPYTNFNINSNGYITFGTTLPLNNNYTAISATTDYAGAIAAFSRDNDGRFVFQATTTLGSPVLSSVSHFGGIVVGKQVTSANIPAGATIVSFNAGAQTITLSANATATGTLQTCIAYTAEIRTQTLGSSPNRIHVIQFKNFKRYGSTYYGELYNFQIKLYETSNKAEIVYGNHVGYSALTTGQVGIRGANNNDYNNRTTTTNWSSTTAGTSNTASCIMSNTVYPSSGLIFTYIPPVGGTPFDPFNPSPADGAANIEISGNLTWSFGANTVTYDLKFGHPGSMVQVVTGGIAGSTGSYTYTADYGSTYQWQVIEHNGTLTTNGPVWTFITICQIVSLPYFQNFDSVTAPALPNCTTYENTNIDPYYWQTYANALNPPSLPNVLYVRYNSSLAMDDWFFTPGFWLSSGTTYTLNFKYTNNSSIYFEKLEVKWGLEANSVAMTNGPIFNDAAIQYSNVWHDGTGTITPTTSGVYFIGFHGYSEPNQVYLLLDNISFYSCSAPIELDAIDVMETTATLQWLETGSATSWDIEFGPIGFIPTGIPTVTGVQSNSYNYENLTSCTNYDFYVRSVCTEEETSFWSGPKSFSTKGPSFIAPFYETFSTWPPLCFDLSGGSFCWMHYAPSSTQGSALANFWSVNQNNNCLMITNTIDISALETPSLEFFWSHIPYPTLLNDSLEVFVSDDNAFSWSKVWSLGGPDFNSNDGAAYQIPGSFISSGIIDLSSFGDNILIKCNGISGFGSDLFIDNISVDEGICPEPSNLFVTNITHYSANLGWIENGSAATWEIELDTAGFIPTGVPTASNISSNPYNYNNLLANTEYDFYVRANCSNNYGNSAWVGPYTFTTLSKAINIKVFLEGPYFSGQMSNFLNALGYLPLDQPYNSAPWQYLGNESVINIPSVNIIDWVLIEILQKLISGNDTNYVAISRKAAFVFNDGVVRDIDGTSPLDFPELPPENFYLRVIHRNHLPIISSFPITGSAGIYNYDFTVSSNTGLGGSHSQSQLTPNVWGMIAADGNSDGLINNLDKNDVWLTQLGLTGYYNGDYNMNSQVEIDDKIIKWKPNSGKGIIITVTIPSVPCGEGIIDIRDGQSYSTVQIGTQCWMAENMNIGTMIDFPIDQSDDGIIQKYCYENNENNCLIYGGLYQWNEAMQYSTGESNVGICPEGWHMPTDDEYCTLMTFLDPTLECYSWGWPAGSNVGGMIKETGYLHWDEPNTGATNSSGLSFLGAGLSRQVSPIGPVFAEIKLSTYIWTSTEFSETQSIYRNLNKSSGGYGRSYETKVHGFVVRCIKD